jgi:integrase
VDGASSAASASSRGPQQPPDLLPFSGGGVVPGPGGAGCPPIAQRVNDLAGRRAYTMMISAAFTGMRWGELTGLAKPSCRTTDGYVLIDPELGALHEVGGQMWLGPPKSDAAARRIDLPPFLINLLDEVMGSHGHEQVFASPTGRWLRRSNFDRRIWRPACDGDPSRDWPPVITGAVFHGLRHFHKTLLDEAGHPDVMVHERMGHQMPGIGGVYSHVTDAMRKCLITDLQRRWTELTK